MNVLHLSRFSYSGQTTHVFSLVHEQQKRGINALLAMDGYPSLQAMALYKDQINELRAAIIKPDDSAAPQRLIRGKKIQLIHAHSSLTYPMAASLAEKLRIPYLVTCHSLGLNREQYRPFFQHARFIICISPRVAASMREFAHKLQIIPNGVDLNEFTPAVKSDPVKIALVARMDQTKQIGYIEFCKAADIIKEMKFYVAANKNPHSKTVEYLGWTNRVASLLSQTDIVVGTGRAILEGMASGNAALILGQTYQGILTPEKAGKQSFLDVSGLSGSEPGYRDIYHDLRKLLQNRKYLRQLQEFGRELVMKDFNNEVHTKQILELYRNTIS